MKRTLKKTPPLAETLIEHEETKGKTISIYLDAESLRYLEQLCQLYKAGKSEVVQQLIIQNKKASLAIIPLLPENLAKYADDIRKMAYG